MSHMNEAALEALMEAIRFFQEAVAFTEAADVDAAKTKLAEAYGKARWLYHLLVPMAAVDETDGHYLAHEAEEGDVEMAGDEEKKAPPPEPRSIMRAPAPRPTAEELAETARLREIAAQERIQAVRDARSAAYVAGFLSAKFAMSEDPPIFANDAERNDYYCGFTDGYSS